METLIQDMRYGARQLMRQPGFTLVAVLTLALGIGANTAIFSVVHAVLLRPLPYFQPERLVVLSETTRDGDEMGVAYPNFEDWRQRARSFSAMASYRDQSFNLTGIEPPLHLQGRMVNANFFGLLGVRPERGRLFTEQDDHLGAERTVLFSHGLWQERFGGDPGVIGSSVTLQGQRFTLIGVLPAGFEYFGPADVYVPLSLYLTPYFGLLDRGNHMELYVLARLKDGTTHQQARVEVKALAAQLQREYPATNSGNGAMLQPLEEVLVQGVRPTLLVLFAAVGFVLLIAAVNVANLLLARAAARQKELAVRIALGAGRARLIRQMLTESLLLSGLGGLAGLLLGAWALEGLLAVVPAGSVPRINQVGLDPTVLIFTLAVSLFTGLLFGLLPARQAARALPQEALKAGARSIGALSRHRTRRALLVAEVGLAVMLLAGAGLMIRTVIELTQVETGFRPENLLVARLLLPQQDYPVPRRLVLYRELVSRVQALPGVESAALTMSLPSEAVGTWTWDSIFIVGDKPVPDRTQLPWSFFLPVSPGYFETMGVRLMRGRLFTDADNENASTTTVINETLARRYWPNEDPIGKRLKQGWPESKTPWREVIGVVADVKLTGVDQPTPPQAYLPLAQQPVSSLAVVVRTAGNPLALASSVEQTVHSFDKDLPVFSVRSMDQLMENAIAGQRLAMALLAGLGGLAVTLAATGIYGVISYSVAQRTQEIGVRMALGAQPGNILRLVLGEGFRTVLVGIGLGLAGALALTRLMASLLFGVGPTDPVALAGAALVLLGAALAACYVPARRATRVDPLVALRYE